MLIDEPRRSAVRATSAGRAWNGLEVFIADASAGFIQSSPSTNHRVCMHVSAPIRSACRCDGRLLLRVQTPGDLDVMPPVSFAHWRDEGSSTILAMRVQPELLESVGEEIGVKVRATQPQLNVRDARIEHIGWALKTEIESQQPAGRLYAESLGIALCIQLLRLYGSAISVRATSSRERGIQRAIDYIHDHLDADLSLMELAAIAGFSPTYFKIAFKASTGAAVHQYVLKTRVDSAVDLISRGGLGLRDIAMQTGFADQSHMSRCVRQLTGKSPRLLRADTESCAG